MHITMIGAGAMGCLFGGLLSEAGMNVRFYDIDTRQVAALNDAGLTIVKDGRERQVAVMAHHDPAEIPKTDLAILFVKHGHTQAAAPLARQLIGADGYLLTLQNGMGNAEIISREIPASQILCGTTAQGAMVLGPGRVQHSGQGPTVIGPWQGAPLAVLEDVASLLSRANIATEVVEDVHPVLWKKLFVNVGINAITALTGIRNGELLDLAATRELVAMAVQEAMAVARALGVAVAEDTVDQVLAVAQATGPNRSSMGQDVDARRPTEIGAINGYIVQRGRETGCPTPVNQTLTLLIETLQAHYSDPNQ